MESPGIGFNPGKFGKLDKIPAKVLGFLAF